MQRHAASCVVLRCAEAVGDTPAGGGLRSGSVETGVFLRQAVERRERVVVCSLDEAQSKVLVVLAVTGFNHFV